MSVTPKRNLPPQSEVWGRSVDQRLDTIQAQSSRQSQDIGNTLTGVNASLVRLSEQVGEIRTITETLVEQQATLQAQQEQLTTQQATLTQTVGELQTVVNGMILPMRNGGGASNFAIYTTATPILSINFVTPAGYSKALVFSVTTLTARNNKASDDYVYSGVRTAGDAYNTSFGVGLANGGWETVTSHGSRLISDLSPGQTVTVEAMVRTQSEVWDQPNNRLNMDSQILFLR